MKFVVDIFNKEIQAFTRRKYFTTEIEALEYVEAYNLPDEDGNLFSVEAKYIGKEVKS